jgi:hypothetical protein
MLTQREVKKLKYNDLQIIFFYVCILAIDMAIGFKMATIFFLFRIPKIKTIYGLENDMYVCQMENLSGKPIMR